MVQNKLWKKRTGNKVWQCLEKANLLPGRTWQSLRGRALKVIFADGVEPAEMKAANGGGGASKKKALRVEHEVDENQR